MTEVQRINVPVTAETGAALQRVIDREGVSLTEAVRRLVGFGDFVYRAVKVTGGTLFVRQGDIAREVEIL